MNSYDADTTRVYVENGGGFCPECDHDDCHPQRPTYPEGGQLTVDWSCPRCKAEWRDVYLLDDVRQDRAGTHHNQQQLFERIG